MVSIYASSGTRRRIGFGTSRGARTERKENEMRRSGASISSPADYPEHTRASALRSRGADVKSTSSPSGTAEQLQDHGPLKRRRTAAAQQQQPPAATLETRCTVGGAGLSLVVASGRRRRLVESETDGGRTDRRAELVARS